MPPSYLHSQDFEEVVPTLLFPVIVITFMCGKEVMGDATCPKDFKCYKSGFENLCKAQEVGLETFLECLEEHAMECTFSVRFGGLYYCRCPLRVYISKKFKK
jgi:hypothetical protein